MSSMLAEAETVAATSDHSAFNLAVWDEIIANRDLAAMPHRFETDEHGQIIMSPPPAPSHGDKQSLFSYLLRKTGKLGKVISECPVSTKGGVKAVDVAWCSIDVWQESKEKSCLVRAPELCVEILSPSNTRSEIDEKCALYFEAGAQEVWLCSKTGAITKLGPDGTIAHSKLFPDFPGQLTE